ncbi:hypothetical protein Q9966_014070 [Columba livia]|nr:hypothetical protein Q9966_014070 [Columba livia]
MSVLSGSDRNISVTSEWAGMWDLLALLQEHGPSTEGIFRLAAGERASRELREALDSGAQVQLERQPVHLLAAILKEFLRKIPSKLLQAELYQDWMSALHNTSRQERLAGLKDWQSQCCLVSESQGHSKELFQVAVDTGTVALLKKLTSHLRLVQSSSHHLFPPPAATVELATRLDLLALLQEHGPSTEGIFRLAAGERASRELREALDSGAQVQLERQPVHLLAAILKEFLRKIPSKLLQAELYQDWMSALHNTSRQERLAGLKDWQSQCCLVSESQGHSKELFQVAVDTGTVALLKKLTFHLRLVQSSSHHLFPPPAATVELATRLDLLALLQEHGPSTEGIFRLAAGERASRELREALDSGAQVQLERQPVHLLAAILKEFLRKIPSKLLQAELYQDWMSALHNTSRQERLAGLKDWQSQCCLVSESQGHSKELFQVAVDTGTVALLKKLTSHLRLVQSSSHHLFPPPAATVELATRLDLLALLQEHGPSTEGIFRLAAGERASRELREALDSGAQVQLESQLVHLLAAILKEFLRKIPSKLLQAELYQDWMSALHNTSRQERLAGLKDWQSQCCLVSESQGHSKELFQVAVDTGTVALLKKLTFHLRLVQSSSHHLLPPPAAMVELATRLDLLALLQEHGPSTEGIFRLAAGERASRELREALDSGAQVQLERQPVHLLAAILKEFLRKIPSKLLQAELYQDWMSALHNTSRQERLAGLKDWQSQCCLVSESQGHSKELFQVAVDTGTVALLKKLTFHLRLVQSSSHHLFPPPAATVELATRLDLLALLQEHGPSTEGIFRLAAGERASRELREALDSGAQVQLERQPVHLLAAILKEFLRKIPSKLLQAELYQDWMSALHNTSRQERLAGLKDWQSQCCLVSESQGHSKELFQVAVDTGTVALLKKLTFHLRLVQSSSHHLLPPPAAMVELATRLDLLALLQEHGPSTEGIFRLAAGERASRELREALDSGAQVQLERQPVHLLAAILKEFLRKIPSKLLQAELYQDWMSALHNTSRQERLAGLKDWQSQCCLVSESQGHSKELFQVAVDTGTVALLKKLTFHLRLVQSSSHHLFPLPAATVELATRLDLLALLQEHGPSTEGIFRLAAGERASRELREALDSGAQVQLERQPVHLLAAILKEFLRKIPSKLLQAELYQDWMSALHNTSRQERLAGLKDYSFLADRCQTNMLHSRREHPLLLFAQGKCVYAGHLKNSFGERRTLPNGDGYKKKEKHFKKKHRPLAPVFALHCTSYKDLSGECCH